MSPPCGPWSARPSATSAPPPPPAEPPTDPTVAALRRVVDDLAASTHAIGELMLEVAPAYLSDTDAADVLALLCDQIGKPLEHGLAARRYAMSGDRRALHGVLCQRIWIVCHRSWTARKRSYGLT
ncbi:hypothetical protein [Streptomyces syringium]|uniref:hypothetical protein n=1 Tax=Streptomyces syringium TaxID=76729 RepID=UPI0033D9252A